MESFSSSETDASAVSARAANSMERAVQISVAEIEQDIDDLHGQAEDTQKSQEARERLEIKRLTLQNAVDHAIEKTAVTASLSELIAKIEDALAPTN